MSNRIEAPGTSNMLTCRAQETQRSAAKCNARPEGRTCVCLDRNLPIDEAYPPAASTVHVCHGRRRVSAEEATKQSQVMRLIETCRTSDVLACSML